MVEDILKLDFNIAGVVIPRIDNTYVDLSNIDNKLLKICLLSENDLNNLSTKNISKINLLNNINNDVIVLNDFSKGLNDKEIKYFNRLFKKLISNNKKIIIISRDINYLVTICDSIVVYQDRIIYSTKDMFDDKLYKYVDMPGIISFIKYNQNKGINLMNTVDINELIKDIYRRRNENKSSN